MKFYNFDVEKKAGDEIVLSFQISGLKGVDLIVAAFYAGKNLLEDKVRDGLMGFLDVAATLYGFIKAGKKG